ncbi:MAG: O-methyltransferase [Actinomycetota bacterium]
MTQERFDAVDRYLNELFVSGDDAADAALRASEEACLPPIAVAPNQGKLLLLLARLRGAKTILEIGTLGGYSTIWLARGLPADGRLITLEIDPKCAEVARANIERASLSLIVEVRLGAALETLEQLTAEGAGPFDLIFIDADKETYPQYLSWALELSAPGTLIIADNVVLDGEVIDPANADPRVQGVRRFIGSLADDPRVDATVIQTVGVKGHDGLAFAIVT